MLSCVIARFSKIIPVGYGSRSRIGRIMNGYIIYLFHRNLWSGIGIRCQKLHINKRCSFCLPLFRSAISASIPGYLFLSGLSFTLFHAHLKNAYPNAHAAKSNDHNDTYQHNPLQDLDRVLFSQRLLFLLEDPEEVFFTETGRPLWDGLGDFLPVWAISWNTVSFNMSFVSNTSFHTFRYKFLGILPGNNDPCFRSPSLQ